jgi:hypothetical protein
MSGSVLELLEQARVALDGARAVELADLSDEELCALTERTEQVGRLVDSARVRSAGELENRSRFELGSDGLAFRLGQRRASQLIEVITLVPASEANRRVRLGTAIRAGHTLQGAELPSPFPHILKALHAGLSIRLPQPPSCGASARRSLTAPTPSSLATRKRRS